MLRIQRNDFNVDDVLRGLRRRKDAGALVNFVGVVRSEENMSGIEIEAYEEMALEKLRGLEEEAKKKFGVEDVVMIHRVGRLKPGENIALIAVSSAHRKEAFKACEWLIDELKKIAPIWKKDIHDEDG